MVTKEILSLCHAESQMKHHPALAGFFIAGYYTDPTWDQIIHKKWRFVHSVGTLDASVVSPREVFKSCILSNSAAFIAIHNHPSGSITPSLEDKDVTKRLLSCSELLGVKMLDHIIIGGETGDMYSFKSDGLLDQLRPVRAVWER